MNIAIIDADLIGKKKHRFPNLACMKISGYYKKQDGNCVELKLDYENLDQYDKVFISKVFTNTPIDEDVLNLPNVEYGGTGFFFDEAPNLPVEIEHCFPDYHLYDGWIELSVEEERKRCEGVGKEFNERVFRNQFKEYTDYSIGFLTRGCFRKCSFCVNQKYDRVFEHSPLEEFYDPTRKKICLLDDNFFGCPNWKELLQTLKDTGKPFKFKQGLDERILTDEKCEMLFSSKYDRDITFAFDDVEDYELIERKLQMIRRYTDKQCVFYVLCGFDKGGRYDKAFWDQDIIDVFRRIELLIKYKCLPYIMRYEKYEESPYRGMYVTFARWCNQFSFMKKNSLLEYARDVRSNGLNSSAYRYIMEYRQDHPEVAEMYYNMKWLDYNDA